MTLGSWSRRIANVRPAWAAEWNPVSKKKAWATDVPQVVECLLSFAKLHSQNFTYQIYCYPNTHSGARSRSLRLAWDTWDPVANKPQTGSGYDTPLYSKDCSQLSPTFLHCWFHQHRPGVQWRWLGFWKPLRCLLAFLPWWLQSPEALDRKHPESWGNPQALPFSLLHPLHATKFATIAVPEPHLKAAMFANGIQWAHGRDWMVAFWSGWTGSGPLGTWKRQHWRCIQYVMNQVLI